MARTITHKPGRLFLDEDFLANIPWVEFIKHANLKGKWYAREDRRRIRRAPIDEEGVALTNTEAKSKADPFAANRYW